MRRPARSTMTSVLQGIGVTVPAMACLYAVMTGLPGFAQDVGTHRRPREQTQHNPARADRESSSSWYEGFRRADGAQVAGADCNFNGVPDVLDIELGTSQDCNQSLVPDECEIAHCQGEHACDDCNVNGVPDECDIAFGNSRDADGNGVPDECINFTAEQGRWSKGENWAGGVVPDNTFEETFNVTLRGPQTFVDLDTTVEINSIRLLEGATLRISSIPGADLFVVGTEGVLIRGRMLVGNTNALVVPNGPLVLGCGGTYMADPAAVQPVEARLLAKSIELRPTCCGGADQLEQMALQDHMVVVTQEGFVMNGTLPQLETFSCPQPQTAGGLTPPIHRATPTAVLDIGGDMEMEDAAIVSIDTGEPVAVASSSPSKSVVVVHGNFRNDSRFAPGYNWSNGSIRLADATVYEVAGLDVGPALTGFNINGHTNYSVKTMMIDAGSKAIFVNKLDNLVGAGACTEALYVRELIVRDSAIVLIDNVRIYYETLVVEPDAGVDPIGCGALIPICLIDAFGPGANGFNTGRHLSNFAGFQNCFTGAGPLKLDACCRVFDLDLDDDVDETDYVLFLEQLFTKADCCTAHPFPGCNDPEVNACVCVNDPFCCAVEWDGICVQDVTKQGCGDCCGNGTCEFPEDCDTCPDDCTECSNSCCTPNIGPGCDDPEVEACVCFSDLFCCEMEWDEFCAEAADDCGSCNGNCCEPNGNPGCDDETIESCVCEQDPFCCDVEWDGICAGEVVKLGCGTCLVDP